MEQLHLSAPAVYAEFSNGKHAVSRSMSKFNRVWTDMALEQSLNCQVKSTAGIVGFSTNYSARNRWIVTAHVRAQATENILHMAGLVSQVEQPHKQSSSFRIQRDEQDVQSIVDVVHDVFGNPFKASYNNYFELFSNRIEKQINVCLVHTK